MSGVQKITQGTVHKPLIISSIVRGHLRALRRARSSTTSTPVFAEDAPYLVKLIHQYQSSQQLMAHPSQPTTEQLANLLRYQDCPPFPSSLTLSAGPKLDNCASPVKEKTVHQPPSLSQKIRSFWTAFKRGN